MNIAETGNEADTIMDTTDFSRIGSLEHKTSEVQTGQREAELRAELEKAAEMAAELSMADTRERLRIVAEVKDNIGQIILLARINLDMLSGVETPAEYASVLEKARNLLDQAVDEICELVLQLSPPLLAAAGLECALKCLCRQIEDDTGLRVEFTDDGSKKTLENVPRAVVYHAARELLFNVAQHAKAGEARLAVGRSGNMLVLVVEDRGAGFDSADAGSNEMKKGCFGLLTIRQRIQRLGGDITLSSTRGEGTGVTIRVPLSMTQRGEGEADDNGTRNKNR